MDDIRFALLTRTPPEAVVSTLVPRLPYVVGLAGAATKPMMRHMKPQPEPSTQEVLAGLVERVTYHNAENGFCVLRTKARGHRDLITLVGHAATIAAGEWITASGEWINDRTHGQQFKARFLRTSLPDSADGIEKYLSSGMIRGVGPVLRKEAGTRLRGEGIRRHRGNARPTARCMRRSGPKCAAQRCLRVLNTPPRARP